MAMASASLLSNKLTQYIRQDAAVAECHELLRRVDPRDRLKLDDLVADRPYCDQPAWFETMRDARQLVALAARQRQRRRGGASLELQRQHPHVHEIAAVDALETLRDHRLDAEQQRSLRRPVARRA